MTAPVTPRAPWPPPDPTWTVGSARPRPAAIGLSVIGSILGACGVFGALLPAMAGQRVGDPDTAIFWIGAAMGAVGAGGALTCGLVALGRSNDAAGVIVLAVVDLLAAIAAGFLTLALLLAG